MPKSTPSELGDLCDFDLSAELADCGDRSMDDFTDFDHFVEGLDTPIKVQRYRLVYCQMMHSTCASSSCVVQ